MAPRPWHTVPRPLWLVLVLALLLQLFWQARHVRTVPAPADLPPPPPLALLQVASLGEPQASSRLSMLYVQGFDEQAGRSVAWRRLDYGRLARWLENALALDPRSQYPLLAASQVYGAVNDPARVRQMLALVAAHFPEDPNRRWPWLAHAALVARHRLHDLPLARRYAALLRQQATGPQVPAWARELEAFILEDMGEAQAAELLIGALLHEGRITDPQELAFLAQRLDTLRAQKGRR